MQHQKIVFFDREWLSCDVNNFQSYYSMASLWHDLWTKICSEVIITNSFMSEIQRYTFNDLYRHLHSFYGTTVPDKQIVMVQ